MHGDGHSCRTDHTPADHRSKLLVGGLLLMILQLDLAQAGPYRRAPDKY